MRDSSARRTNRPAGQLTGHARTLGQVLASRVLLDIRERYGENEEQILARPGGGICSRIVLGEATRTAPSAGETWDTHMPVNEFTLRNKGFKPRK